MVSRYATLASLEAELGIDFSTISGITIGDDAIYTPTVDCIIGAASRKINDYTQTTFSAHGSGCPSVITDVCHELTLRMITRAINWQRMTGLIGTGDDFGSFNIEGDQSFEVELTKSEKRRLNQQTSIALRVESD